MVLDQVDTHMAKNEPLTTNKTTISRGTVDLSVKEKTIMSPEDTLAEALHHF